MNIAHRDIKPDNLLVTKKGVLLITDFGTAEILKEGDLTTQKVGTRAFHPPELYQEGECESTEDYLRKVGLDS